jgi:predicted ATPase/DNA-binding XRE family transcriptional regulator
MTSGAPRSFGAQLKALREAAGYTQEELATIAGLSVHAVSALERGERRRPHVETVRALSAALDLTGAVRDAFVGSARPAPDTTAVDELSGVSLPLAPTALLGRDSDIETLRQWLADPAVRLLTLTGPGGVGKTRLALEVAHAIAADGVSRVVFVPLATIPTPALVASTIAEALGLSNVTPLELPKRARAACADQRTLLVLDNFEHVIDAAPLVAELLTSVASLRVLSTSRALLHVRGEREYALGPLALEASAAKLSPADLARLPAVRLFVERVRDVQPDFRLTSANGATVTAICRRLDALPLALELAAPWIKVLTAEDLLRRLEEDVLLSTAGPRDLPERQQTMSATVSWSYQLLGAREQRAFRRLGALPGRFPIDAAAAVLAGREEVLATSDDALGAIAELIDKSLLLRAEASVATRPLYQMLETVRAFAALELAASGEREDALEGLARYCTGEASLALDALRGPAQAEWLDRVRDDLENYRGALTWLIERARPGEASDIAWGLLWFWAIRGHAIEGLRWYEQILTLPSLASGAESRALVGAAGMRCIRGEFERARTDLTRALALARGADDIGSVVHAEFVFGHVEYAVGNLDAAGDHFARSVEGFKSAGNAWGTGQVLSGMAWVALAKGEAGEAERLLDEAVVALRHAGPWFLLPGLCIRAILSVQRGNPDEAIAVARESLTHIRNLQDKWNLLYTIVALAAAAALKGDDAWVARILGARDAVIETTGATVLDASVHDLQETVSREARARLGPDRWALAYATGRKASIDGLLKDIDGVLQRRPAGQS